MLRDSRKMNDLKIYLKEILEKEYYICDIFNAHVEAGMITSDQLNKFCDLIKDPSYFDDKLVSIKKEDIMNNPYLQNIKISNVQENHIRLSRKRLLPANTITAYKEKRRDLETFKQINSYFVCDNNLRLPGIIEGDTMVCWMTVEPFEINTFENFINVAKGKVLLLGCGLGYVAYMLSLKQEVKQIIIVDNNPDIIKLFQENILCQFEQKNKIQVIQSDALEYMNHTNLNFFDYVNVDIWHDSRDMILSYLPCLEVERFYPRVSFSYWLESELKESIQTSILAAACDFDNDLQGCILQKIGKDMIEKTKIENRGDLVQLLQLNNFRNTLCNWYIDHKVEFENMRDLELQSIGDAMEKSKLFQKKISFK